MTQQPKAPSRWLLYLALFNLGFLGPFFLTLGIENQSTSIEVEAILIMVLGITLLTIYRSRLHHYKNQRG